MFFASPKYRFIGLDPLNGWQNVHMRAGLKSLKSQCSPVEAGISGDSVYCIRCISCHKSQNPMYWCILMPMITTIYLQHSLKRTVCENPTHLSFLYQDRLSSSNFYIENICDDWHTSIQDFIPIFQLLIKIPWPHLVGLLMGIPRQNPIAMTCQR